MPARAGMGAAWAPPPFEVREGSPALLTEIVRQKLDARAASMPAPTGPFVIGVAGGVAVGKSTFAGELGEQVGGAQVIGTDGFLFPNTTLNALGLLSRKGFPESYDTSLAADLLHRIAEGQTDVAVPRYSHTTYDIDGPPQVVSQPNVLIVEGVNALQPPFAGYSSLRIYLDADEPDLRRWYADRFVSLVQQGEGFYARWTGAPEDEVRSLATMTWEYVNLPNLIEHILPTRWTADVVVRKGADHAVAAIAVRPQGG